ncbi:MAG: hypothetical protein QXO25_05585, partial [Candidatus Bathyarchaeia archaeon]
MRVGMMTPWNSNSGPSTCAELIGREWVRRKHELTVFSHDGSSVSDGVIIQEDEPYVIRCFGTSYWKHKDWLDARPLLESPFEFFLVQHLSITPMKELLKVFPQIRAKSRTVLVIHENSLPKDPTFFRFSWDAVVCFDERYKSFLVKAFPPSKIHIIPFPYHPMKAGDKMASRRELNLPLDRKVVLFFGYSVWRNKPIMEPLAELGREYPIHILALSTDEHSIEELEAASRRLEIEIEIRREAPPLPRLYKYLHASDALVKHVDEEWKEDVALISSTIHLCLGSGCPIVVSDAKIFETYNRQVV